MARAGTWSGATSDAAAMREARMEIMATRRFSMPAMLGLALVLGLPMLAEAQLFPNATIKRQRVSCLNEDPVYRMYRQQYYGYFPTCWRRFPDGWGCPSRESSAAEVAKAMQEIQKSVKELSEATQTEEPPATTDEGEMPAPLDDRKVPDLPAPGESPFENPARPAAPKPLDDGGEAPAAPAPAAENRQAARSDAAVRAPARRPGGVSSTVSEIEDLVPPSDVPPIESTPAGETEARTSPSLPSAAVPPLGAAAGTPVTVPGPSSAVAPVQAPARRTLIGGLFDNIRGLRRR